MFNDYRTHYSHDFRPELFSMGRHHGGQGFGHFASGWGGGFGRGGGGFRTGRKFASADLHLIILALLEDKPRHGYEIIKALEERSGGFYTPSPGMIYPALTYLEEIGYATIESEGPKKLYSITDPGRQHLEQNRAMTETMLSELEQIGSRMDDVRRVFSGEARPSRGDNEEEPFDPRRGSREVRDARRELKMALYEKRGCPPEEARRIAQLLRRTAQEIGGKS
jgi:DNA-binding PadR family transcriptional regulator